MADLQNFVGDTIQKIAVVGHHENDTLKPDQKILQPGYHLIVQMVGRLIQDQHV